MPRRAFRIRPATVTVWHRRLAGVAADLRACHGAALASRAGRVPRLCQQWPIASRFLRSPVIAAAIVLLTLGTVGCGPQFGALLYHSGLVPQEKVPAAFKLPDGPLLILVDDDLDLIRPAQTREVLVDEIAKTLRERAAVNRVTTNDEIAAIRRTEPEFDQIAADAVGRLVNADTVLWLSTKNYVVNDNIEMAVTPGRFAVNVRVLNAKADQREDVRLWPNDREGKVIEATITAHDIRKCRTKKEVHELMAVTMAEEVAHLFYDRKIEQ